MNTFNVVSMPLKPVAESTAYSTPAQVGKPLQARAPESGNVIPLEQQQAVAKLHSPPDKSGQLSEAVEKMNKLIQSVQRELHFSVDDVSGRTVIVVRDIQTQEVIRQIPSEEALNLADKLQDHSELDSHAIGLLVENKV